MKNLKRKLTIILALVVGVLLIDVTAYAKTYKGLFVYWRGETACGQGFKEGLKNLGYKISATEFNANKDKKKLNKFLSSIKEKDFDFVYTFGTTVSVTSAKYIKNTPIFFGIVTNPLKAGLVKSWENSGNNTTGVSHAIPYGDQVDFILRIGEIKSIGIIYNPKEQNSIIAKTELDSLLKKRGVSLKAYPAGNKGAIQRAVKKISSDRPDIVYLPSDSFIVDNGGKIISALTAAKMPTYGALEKFINEQGAMIGIVSSYKSVGLALAENADQVFKGKSPRNVPSRTLPENMLTIKINGKTVESIGYDIPYQIISLAEIIE